MALSSARKQARPYTLPSRTVIRRWRRVKPLSKATKPSAGRNCKAAAYEEILVKLGFVSAVLPELNLEQVLAFAAQERFACVEAMCWPIGKAERKYAGVTHINVAGFTRASAEDVRALC